MEFPPSSFHEIHFVINQFPDKEFLEVNHFFKLRAISGLDNIFPKKIVSEGSESYSIKHHKYIVNTIKFAWNNLTQKQKNEIEGVCCELLLLNLENPEIRKIPISTGDGCTIF